MYFAKFLLTKGARGCCCSFSGLIVALLAVVLKVLSGLSRTTAVHKAREQYLLLGSIYYYLLGSLCKVCSLKL